MKAILEVEFDKDQMICEEGLKDFDGDMFKALQWMYKEDNIGVFANEIKLVAIKD